LARKDLILPVKLIGYLCHRGEGISVPSSSFIAFVMSGWASVRIPFAAFGVRAGPFQMRRMENLRIAVFDAGHTRYRKVVRGDVELFKMVRQSDRAWFGDAS
jgi:hypothetical protein